MNAGGLWDWWVTLEKMPDDVEAGASPLIGYYVSPYGGFVRESGVGTFTRAKDAEPDIRAAPRDAPRRPRGLRQF